LRGWNSGRLNNGGWFGRWNHGRLSCRLLDCDSGCFRCGCSSTAAITYTDQGSANLNRVIFRDKNRFDYAGNRRGDLRVYLVGGNFDQWFVDSNAVSDLLQPACDGAFGDGFAKGWQIYFLTHLECSPFESVRCLG
jgi:hypothetical protein